MNTEIEDRSLKLEIHFKNWRRSHKSLKFQFFQCFFWNSFSWSVHHLSLTHTPFGFVYFREGRDLASWRILIYMQTRLKDSEEPDAWRKGKPFTISVVKTAVTLSVCFGWYISRILNLECLWAWPVRNTSRVSSGVLLPGVSGKNLPFCSRKYAAGVKVKTQHLILLRWGELGSIHAQCQAEPSAQRKSSEGDPDGVGVYVQKCMCTFIYKLINPSEQFPFPTPFIPPCF